MSLAPNRAVFPHRDREHVRKEPQPAGNAMYRSLPFPLRRPSVIHKNNENICNDRNGCRRIDSLQGS